jgi:hypothetical protein
MSFTPRIHWKTHKLENLYDVAAFLTGKVAKTHLAFIDVWGPIKAADILNNVNFEDIGTYIIQCKEFQILNDFQKRALNALVDAKKSIKKDLFNSSKFEQIKRQIIDDEVKKDIATNELLELTEDKIRLDEIAKARHAEIQEMEQRELENRLAKILSKGGKRKTRKYRKGYKKNNKKVSIKNKKRVTYKRNTRNKSGKFIIKTRN